MEIRDLGQADLPALAGLLEDLSGQAPNLPAMARSLAAMAANPDYHPLGAFASGELAGSVLGVVCLDLVGSCRPFLVVENLIVAGWARRRGVARTLLAALEARGRARNCRYAMLVSGAARTAAHACYASLGYAGSGVLGFKKYL